MADAKLEELDDSEVEYAIGRGAARQKSSDLKNSRPAFAEQYSGQLLENHKHGACAELAVRKFLSFPLALGVDEYFVPDIEGTRIEVRWSRYRDKCKVRHRDIESGRVIVGTIGSFSHIEILGWILASDAPARGKPSSRDDDRPPCIFIEDLAWENPHTLTADIYAEPSDGT